ncbi:MAG: hypothetical protein ACI9ZV_000042 [Candidatus Azotimanducaceae bacterium]|jgi:hypothetical protein
MKLLKWIFLVTLDLLGILPAILLSIKLFSWKYGNFDGAGAMAYMLVSTR